MKIFFVYHQFSSLADERSLSLEKTRAVLLSMPGVEEVSRPELADAIILQEKRSFKNFRYIEALKNDPLIQAFIGRIFTINQDDCATGLLRGLYTSIPKHRYDPRLFASVPYMEFLNELVFNNHGQEAGPQNLAVWHGSKYGNKVRFRLLDLFEAHPRIKVSHTETWINHSLAEKQAYIQRILDAKFSLCPAGWAPVSYRIYESMALGRCPVILADGFVPPKGPDWSRFALFVPEAKIKSLESLLLEHEHRYRSLGTTAQEAWRKYFAADRVAEYYASALLGLIAKAPACDLASECRRWRSLQFQWNNRWTLSQRAVNRLAIKLGLVWSPQP